MKNTKEAWKPITDYVGLYEVSSEGRVRNVKTGKILKPKNNRRGYLFVGLHKNGAVKNRYIHRLVAQAFIPNNDQSKTLINHKDENKRNNSVANLEWCTYKYNANYGTRNERVAKSNSKPIQQLDMKTGLIIATYPSTTIATRVTGINYDTISRAARGIYKSAGRFGWRYTN